MKDWHNGKKNADWIEVGPHLVEVTNTDKVLFSEDGITKGDLIGYYLGILEGMLPQLEDRALNMHRFPNGINSKNFFQQEIPGDAPD